MNKKSFGIMMIAALFGVALAFFVNRDAGNSKSSQELSESHTPSAPALGNLNGSDMEATDPTAEHVVVYSDDGFQPSELTISVGETVEFRNNNSRTVWVASDPHPSHTDLPDFNAERGYSPGETYAYTFNQPGTWGYHDHLQSFITGTIVVVE